MLILRSSLPKRHASLNWFTASMKIARNFGDIVLLSGTISGMPTSMP